MERTREIGDRAYERAKHMSHEERRQQLNEGLRNDPFFSRLPTARIVQPRPRLKPNSRTAGPADP